MGKKIQLKKETLRRLTQNKLPEIQGGLSIPVVIPVPVPLSKESCLGACRTEYCTPPSTFVLRSFVVKIV